MPQDSGQSLKHAAIFGFGAMLIPISGVLLLPLYVNYLTPAEFGTLELVNRIANVLCICCLSVGVYHATGAFAMQANEQERGHVAATMLLFYLLAALPAPAVFLPLLTVFCRYFQVDDSSLLLFAVGGNFVVSTLEIPYVLMRCRMESLGFVIVTFLQFLIRVLGTIVAVAWFGWGLWGVIGMYWLSGGLFFVILFWAEFRRGSMVPDLRLLGPITKFAFPFLPGGLCTFVQMNADRFFLARHFDLDEVGIFALAAKLAGCVALLSALPLERVWLVRQYKVLPNEDGPAEAARWLTLIAAVQLAVGLALSLFCRELLTVMGKDEYVRCADVVPVLVLAEFFLYAVYVLEGPMLVYRKTIWKFYLGLAATFLVLMLLALLVPSFGSIGAAVALLACYVFLAGASCLFSQRLRWISYQWRKLAVLLSLAVLLYFAAEYSLNDTDFILRMTVKILLLSVFCSLAALFRPWRLKPGPSRLGEC